jgi:mRNA interferase RelE/StbE
MSYRIVVGRTAQKQLAALPKKVGLRLRRRIGRLSADPRPANSGPLEGGLKPLRKLRVGDYRVVYAIEDDARSVQVVAVGHRSRVYDRLERRM